MVELDTKRTHRILEGILTYGSIPFWLLVLFYAYSQLMPRAQYGILFLGGVLMLFIVSELRDVIKDSDYLHLILLVASAAVIIPVTLYMFFNFDLLYVRQRGRAEPFQIYGAFLFTLVMIYLTWRSFGVTFLVVLLAGIAYGLFGEWMPGVLSHGGITPERMLRILVIEVEGFFGFLNRLMAAWIAPFLLYAGLMQAYGAFDLILRLAVRSARYISSGVAQTAVIASAVVGSINGSQTANAGMTGSFTIPMMKENGIEPKTAAAIESVASTSGQVLPPVMGAGAFIMATLITGETYVDVILAGLIPAFILVVAVVIAVHYVAAPQIDDPTMEGYFEERLPTTTVILGFIKYATPLVLLIYLLGVAQYTVMTGALATAVSMIILGVTIPVLQSLYAIGPGSAGLYVEQDDSDDAPDDREPSTTTPSIPDRIRNTLTKVRTRLDPMIRFRPINEFGTQIRNTVAGFREGARVAAPVAIILAAINGVVDILMASGVPTAVSLALLDLSGGVLVIAAILGMAICILLGLGMPTTAAYTIVALLVAPTFSGEFLLPEFSAHFFVFYGAILAGLTPPIATCVAVASGRAGSDFLASAVESIKLAAPLFILPFAFLYHPELVDGSFSSAALLLGAIALVGAIGMIHGINYHFEFSRPVTWALRLVFFGTSLVAMVHPSLTIQFIAVGILGVLFIFQTLAGKPDPVETLRDVFTNSRPR